jgi:rhodanese-related sulfurtransferase
MRGLKNFLFTFFLCTVLCAQKSIDATLDKFNKESVPYISLTELYKRQDVALLDSREKEEFEVSHLKNAVWVGHREFSIDSVLKNFPDKNSAVVVYCSIGVRSENIGEKLMEAGYSRVENLYGGIFEWKNKGYPVYDQGGEETGKIHAFSRKWGKLLTKGEKVYNRRKRDIDKPEN